MDLTNASIITEQRKAGQHLDCCRILSRDNVCIYFYSSPLITLKENSTMVNSNITEKEKSGKISISFHNWFINCSCLVDLLKKSFKKYNARLSCTFNSSVSIQILKWVFVNRYFTHCLGSLAWRKKMCLSRDCYRNQFYAKTE